RGARRARAPAQLTGPEREREQGRADRRILFLLPPGDRVLPGAPEPSGGRRRRPVRAVRQALGLEDRYGASPLVWRSVASFGMGRPKRPNRLRATHLRESRPAPFTLRLARPDHGRRLCLRLADRRGSP